MKVAGFLKTVEWWLYTLGWLSSVLHPRQHNIGLGHLQVKRPNQKVLKEKATKEKPENANNKIHIYIHINTH